MDWAYLTHKYRAEVALVSRFCIEHAEIQSTGGGCWAICGRLRNGLNVIASNGEMECHDATSWTLGLYRSDEQLAYICDGTLDDQLTIAATLTAAQLQALISRSPAAPSLLPAQIVVL